jgi:hypothetical protein
MSAQPKPTYTQVKGRYEKLREIALKIAHDDFDAVMSNKRGKAILRDEIKLDVFTFKSQHELRRWEKTGLRRRYRL